jgi:superfamily II DNA or RNA helicase
MTLARDYQAHCRDAVLAAWGIEPWFKGGDTFQSLLINLPTSAGKTVTVGLTIYEILERELGRCLFLADTDELCAQPQKKFRSLFGMHASIEKAGDKASRMAPLVVGSAQTLIREERRARYNPDHFQFIFVDEAHRGSDRNKVITNYFAGAKVCGVTATAFRAKLADLSDYYEHVAFEMGMFDLIDEGYIVPYQVLTLPVVVDIRGVHQKMSTEGMDYDKSELDTTIGPYYERICELILEHAADRHIICYLPLIKSSQEFVTIARGLGINARHVDGQSPDRAQILEQFARGDIQLLSNSSLLTTGWDCPRCDCLLNLAPTRSRGLFRQKAGRPGRILPNIIEGVRDGDLFRVDTKEARKAAIAASAKPNALILDLLWQTEKFGLVGPADLIATSEDDRHAIQLKIEGLRVPADLQGVSAEVQAEREAALKKALIEAAKRQSTFNDTINLIAAMLHSKEVMDYEPAMRWERKPVTKKQRAWLEKNSIDPASAKSAGHVSALMNLVFGRERAGLCSHKVVEALEKKGVAGAISMTDWQAYQILGGNFPFPFGKHAKAGHTLRQIPSGFWRWASAPENEWIKKRYPVVADWMLSVIDPDAHSLAMARCTCIGAHQAPNCPTHPKKEVRPDPPAEFSKGRSTADVHQETLALFDSLE